MDDHNEGIWLTYEGILSEVQSEYKAKFDATETVKQWAVARRMFMAGKRNVIQELIEKADEQSARVISVWLKSQMEEE